MAVTFDLLNHRKLWLLMRDNIEDYIKTRYIPTFYDAEVTVDDLKATLFLDGSLGIDYKQGVQPPLFYCFACQYAWDYLRGETTEADKRERCVYCPLTGWEADKCYIKISVGKQEEGLFHQLCIAVEDKEIETAKELCERIANLEVKDGVLTYPLAPKQYTEETVPSHSRIIIDRPGAFYKLPIAVFVLDKNPDSRTYNRYINSEGLLQIGYQDDRVAIANEWDEDFDCIIIDPDTKKYNTPIFLTAVAGDDFNVDRTGNFDILPVTVLVKDNCSNSLTKDFYVDHAPYFTVAHSDNKYRIFNDTEENMSYVITSAPLTVKITDQLIGAGSSFPLAKSNAMTNKPPIVLVKDPTEGGRSENKFINSTGLVTVSLSEQVILIHNDTDISLTCRIIELS